MHVSSLDSLPIFSFLTESFCSWTVRVLKTYVFFLDIEPF
jgi:hypothetical protein